MSLHLIRGSSKLSSCTGCKALKEPMINEESIKVIGLEHVNSIRYHNADVSSWRGFMAQVSLHMLQHMSAVPYRCTSPASATAQETTACTS